MKLIYKAQEKLYLISDPHAEDITHAFQSLDNTPLQLLRLPYGQGSINFITVGDGNMVIRWRIYGKIVFSEDMIASAYTQDVDELAVHGLDFEVREAIPQARSIEIAIDYIARGDLPPSMCFLRYSDGADARIILDPLQQDIQQRLATLDGKERIGFTIQYQNGLVGISYVNQERVWLRFSTRLSPTYKIHVSSSLLDVSYLQQDVELPIPYAQKGDTVMLSQTVDYQKACDVAAFYASRGRFPKGLVWESAKMEQFTEND